MYIPLILGIIIGSAVGIGYTYLLKRNIFADIKDKDSDVLTFGPGKFMKYSSIVTFLVFATFLIWSVIDMKTIAWQQLVFIMFMLLSVFNFAANYYYRIRLKGNILEYRNWKGQVIEFPLDTIHEVTSNRLKGGIVFHSTHGKQAIFRTTNKFTSAFLEMITSYVSTNISSQIEEIAVKTKIWKKQKNSTI